MSRISYALFSWFSDNEALQAVIEAIGADDRAWDHAVNLQREQNRRFDEEVRIMLARYDRVFVDNDDNQLPPAPLRRTSYKRTSYRRGWFWSI